MKPEVEGKKKRLIHCDFCGKSQNKVKEIIQGPKANICNECIEICARVVEESRMKTLVWNTLIELNKQAEIKEARESMKPSSV